MLWAAISFSALNLDRNNLSQANTDNFLPDLKMSTNGKRFLDFLKTTKASHLPFQTSTWETLFFASPSCPLNYHPSWFPNVFVFLLVMLQANLLEFFVSSTDWSRSLDSYANVCLVNRHDVPVLYHGENELPDL
jgi:hypothetical protein